MADEIDEIARFLRDRGVEPTVIDALVENGVRIICIWTRT